MSSMMDMLDKDPSMVIEAITVAALVFPTLRVGQMITNAAGSRSLFHLQDADLATAILDYAAEHDHRGVVAMYRDLKDQETENEDA